MNIGVKGKEIKKASMFLFPKVNCPYVPDACANLMWTASVVSMNCEAMSD
jgi:hypothetical protein